MEMTPEHVKEINDNMERAGEFLRYLIANPLEFEKIPNGSYIKFVDSFENAVPVKGEKTLFVKKTYEYA